MGNSEVVALVNLADQASAAGQFAHALAALERAHQIAPSSPLVRQRLDHSRAKMSELVGAARLDASESDWVRFSRDVPSFLPLLLAGLAAAGLAYRTFKKTHQGLEFQVVLKQRKSWALLSLTLFGLCLSQVQNWTFSLDRGIVLEQTTVRSGPAPTYEEIARIPAGVRVRILEERKSDTGVSWVKTYFDVGRKGWIELQKVGATLPSRKFDLLQN